MTCRHRRQSCGPVSSRQSTFLIQTGFQFPRAPRLPGPCYPFEDVALGFFRRIMCFCPFKGRFRERLWWSKWNYRIECRLIALYALKGRVYTWKVALMAFCSQVLRWLPVLKWIPALRLDRVLLVKVWRNVAPTRASYLVSVVSCTPW